MARIRPKVTEEDVKDSLRLRDKLDRAYEEISNLHATTEALTTRAVLLEGRPPALSKGDRNLLDALSLIGADNLLTSFKIGIPTAAVLPPTASAFHNQTVRLSTDGQVYTFSEATRQWSALQSVADSVLSTNVALLNRLAQVFTDTLAINGGIFERGRGTKMGEWIPFAPVMSSNTGSWAGGVVTTAKYMLVGKAMTVIVRIDGTTVTGTPTFLNVTIPGGFTAQGGALSAFTANDNGTAKTGSLSPAGTAIQMASGPYGTGTWAASAGATSIGVDLTFEIQ